MFIRFSLMYLLPCLSSSLSIRCRFYNLFVLSFTLYSLLLLSPSPPISAHFLVHLPLSSCRLPLSLFLYLSLSPSNPSTVFSLPLSFPFSLCNFSSILFNFPQDSGSSHSLSISHSLLLLGLSLFLIIKKRKKKSAHFTRCLTLRFKTPVSLTLFFFRL